jgi:hypothetical protein
VGWLGLAIEAAQGHHGIVGLGHLLPCPFLSGARNPRLTATRSLSMGRAEPIKFEGSNRESEVGNKRRAALDGMLRLPAKHFLRIIF